jgi:peptide/nickel transport system ATP-binding protein
LAKTLNTILSLLLSNVPTWGRLTTVQKGEQLMPLLEIRNLRTYFRVKRGYVKAVDDVSFEVEKGEAMGLVGESGCGKTTVSLSILRILPSNGTIRTGNILFKATDLVKLTESEMRTQIRWKGISIVFQGAMNALNPVFRIGDQIVEAIQLHEPDVTKRDADERVEMLFELVGVDPKRRTNYPHEFSGGMRQRAMIAMALACNPALLIADEPGTALDVIVAAQVLKLMKDLRQKLNLSMIMVSHDLSIIAETCQKTAVMYGGRIGEYSDVNTIFKEPLHPYTQGLMGAFPGINAAKTRMISIPGSPPDLLYPPTGCRFHPRCQYAMDVCSRKDPELLDAGKKHYVACHLVH